MPSAFWWKDAGRSPSTSGESLLSLWHPRGYGKLGDYLRVPASPHALAYVWRNDNTGPPTSAAEVLADHARIANDFPGAKIVASTLDAFVDAILADDAVSSSLPIVTAEIGDSWLWGCASDPKKLAKFRSAQRQLVYHCGPRNASTCLASSSELTNFSRLLAKAPEHTWGHSFSTYGKFLRSNYSNKEFHAMRTLNYSFVAEFEAEWVAQRRLALEAPLEALAVAVEGSEAAYLRTDIKNEWSVLDKVTPAVTAAADGWERVAESAAEGWIDGMGADGWASVRIDRASGSIVGLKSARTRHSWASASQPLALFCSQRGSNPTRTRPKTC